VTHVKYSAVELLRPVVESLVRFARNLDRNVTHRRKVASTMNELSNLSDRELNDIGVHRGNIRSISEGIWND
jgi:uncharacterized protein YjiS (DUF1127 family)